MLLPPIRYPILYQGAIQRTSEISHPRRPATWGATWHYTVGREAGDITVLDGPRVDCHLYAAKDGDVYQFVRLDRVTWHALHEANAHCISIETEGSGEGWTPPQRAACVRIAAFLNTNWGVPLVHVDPIRVYPDGLMPPPADWHGMMGHRDLVGIDGNNHSDTVPNPPGWGPFLEEARVMAGGKASVAGAYARVVLDGGRLDVVGWEEAKGVIKWIALNGLKTERAAIAWRGPDSSTTHVWRGKTDVVNVCKSIYRRFIV